MPLPVWFLDTGISEASAVLVWVRPIPAPGDAGPPPAAERRLVTAQHVLRTNDQTDGPYSANLLAWPPGISYQGFPPFELEVDRLLSPTDSTPLQGPEDFAFLKFKSATGADPSPLLSDEACKKGMGGLNICGYTTGSPLIDVHQGETVPAPHPAWTLLNHLKELSMGILSPGMGSPTRGTSGGGVFQEDRYAGVYRGAFGPQGQHCFIPIPHLRTWLRAHGYEFVDLSVTGQLGEIGKQLVSVAQQKTDPAVSALLAPRRHYLQLLSDTLLEFRTQKMLHDHLHYLQLPYATAAWAARAGLQDATNLNTYETAICGISGRMELTAKSITAIPQDAGNNLMLEQERARVWHTDIQNALKSASTTQDNYAGASKACDTIGSILRRQMSRINNNLVQNADMMDLTILADLLEQVGSMSTAPGRDDLLSGSKACSTVHTSLKESIDLHHRWQDLDNLLWEVERCLAADAYNEFLMRWQFMILSLNNLTPLAAGANRPGRITDYVNANQALIDSANRLKLPASFQLLARECRDQFMKVDNQLFALADHVASLRRPLQDLL
ncbi:hypothetical protein [Verrucomicrobium sp. BvORR034]|uniref:hypothetical protein n=1 Tax=Verrucomicrobium sp. BvORR034 TaxID=1396418 RepID=UPI000679A5BE|nr:hypothetical protein [Verrucomicrobium sp. BvORR034]